MIISKYIKKPKKSIMFIAKRVWKQQFTNFGATDVGITGKWKQNGTIPMMPRISIKSIASKTCTHANTKLMEEMCTL